MLVFRYVTTPMAFPQHFKKPPIFPSEEANRITSCWNPRLPFSCRASPLLGGYNQLFGPSPQSASRPGLPANANAWGPCGLLSEGWLQWRWWATGYSWTDVLPYILGRMLDGPQYGHRSDGIVTLQNHLIAPMSPNISWTHFAASFWARIRVNTIPSAGPWSRCLVSFPCF